MKKAIAVILAVWALAFCMILPAGAQAGSGAISLRLNSDVAGCTRADAEKLLEIRSGNVIFYRGVAGPIDIANYAGGGEYAHMDAGRTYVITYTLEAADGYTLPEALADGDAALDCGKGVSVISCGIVELRNPDLHPAPGDAPTTRVLRITAKVVTDGTAIQRIIGWLKDIFLKIRWWSLY